jgi:hypothetical protein
MMSKGFKRAVGISMFLVTLVLAVIYFVSFEETNRVIVPVSSIQKSNMQAMKVLYEGKIYKTPQHLDQFFLIQDEVVGDPDGSFYLIKKENVFGFVKYDAKR